MLDMQMFAFAAPIQSRVPTRPLHGFRGQLLTVLLVAFAALVLPIATGYAGTQYFQVISGAKSCYGYGSTGAFPTYAAANTEAVSSSGMPLNQCARWIPVIEWCVESDCWLDTSNPGGYTLQYESQLGAYSANAHHILGFYNPGWTYGATCTSSWTSGATSCP
jgi:hypothetical protein